MADRVDVAPRDEHRILAAILIKSMLSWSQVSQPADSHQTMAVTDVSLHCLQVGLVLPRTHRLLGAHSSRLFHLVIRGAAHLGVPINNPNQPCHTCRTWYHVVRAAVCLPAGSEMYKLNLLTGTHVHNLFGRHTHNALISVGSQFLLF